VRFFALISVALLAACGGDDGDRLLESDIAGVYEGDSFDPSYGFAQFIDHDNAFDAAGHVFLATGEFVCERDGSGRPNDGTFVTIGLPDFSAGSHESVIVGFSKFRAGLEVDRVQLTTHVEVTESDNNVVALEVAFAETVEGEAYSLSGRLTAERCD